MAEVEILSVRLTLHPSTYAECSKERWNEVMSTFSQKARSHAANLAAHGWDILLVDGQVLLTQPSIYRSTSLPGSCHWLCEPDYSKVPSFRPAPRKLIAELYENRGRYLGHKRLFPVEGAPV